MLNKIQKRKQQGFTIIEVLIVLAIAGLIMLVVFLAVPALQRNSRNTQYRNEASQLLTAYSEVSSNAGGAVLTDSNSDTVLEATKNKNLTDLTIGAGAGTVTVTGTDTATIRTGAKCSAPNSNVAVAGSTRQVAVFFNVETSGGTQHQCVDS